MRFVALLLLAAIAAADDLAADLRSASLERRTAALDRILAEGTFPDEALEPLLDGLDELELRRKCERALGLRPEPAVAEIVRQIDLDEKPGKRSWRCFATHKRQRRVHALGTFGAVAKPAVAKLRRIAEDDDALLVRAEAAWAVWRITGDSGDAVRWLAELVDLGIKRRDDALVETAAYALKEIGADAKPAIPSLVRALGIDPPGTTAIYSGMWCRKAAAEALHAVGAPSIEALIGALGSENRNLREEARSALLLFGAEAVKPLIACLGEGRHVADVAWTLGRIGPDASEALPGLRRARESAAADLKRDLDDAIRRIEGR